MKNRIATATEPTDDPAWLMIMLSDGDDAEYHDKMAALLERRIVDSLWAMGEARTLHGLSRAALHLLANTVASFATGRPGFDFTEPSAGILDALEARAKAAPRPLSLRDDMRLQLFAVELLEEQLVRAYRDQDDAIEIRAIETAIRAHRLRVAKLNQISRKAPPLSSCFAEAQREQATDPAFN